MRPALALAALACALATLASPPTAHALPILRKPRPEGAPGARAAAHFGVPEKSLFGSASTDRAAVTSMSFELIGRGFHRTARIVADVSWRGFAAARDCEAAFVLDLHENLYADKFELEAPPSVAVPATPSMSSRTPTSSARRLPRTVTVPYSPPSSPRVPARTPPPPSSPRSSPCTPATPVPSAIGTALRTLRLRRCPRPSTPRARSVRRGWQMDARGAGEGEEGCRGGAHADVDRARGRGVAREVRVVDDDGDVVVLRHRHHPRRAARAAAGHGRAGHHHG